MAPKIKICGITNLADGEQAISCGADYLGMIFVPGTARVISETRAGEIAYALKGKAKLVGVFRDQDLDFVNAIACRLGLDFVQCHGKESAEYCAQVKIPVIKTIELNPGDNPEHDVKSLNCANIAHFLIDKPKGGGKGILPSTLAPFQKFLGNYFLAGSLTPANVVSALADLNPFAVDVCSGVEATPGIKDPLKVQEFCGNCGEIQCKNQA